MLPIALKSLILFLAFKINAFQTQFTYIFGIQTTRQIPFCLITRGPKVLRPELVDTIWDLFFKFFFFLTTTKTKFHVHPLLSYQPFSLTSSTGTYLYPNLANRTGVNVKLCVFAYSLISDFSYNYKVIIFFASSVFCEL